MPMWLILMIYVGAVISLAGLVLPRIEHAFRQYVHQMAIDGDRILHQ